MGWIDFLFIINRNEGISGSKLNNATKIISSVYVILYLELFKGYEYSRAAMRLYWFGYNFCKNYLHINIHFGYLTFIFISIVFKNMDKRMIESIWVKVLTIIRFLSSMKKNIKLPNKCIASWNISKSLKPFIKLMFIRLKTFLQLNLGLNSLIS